MPNKTNPHLGSSLEDFLAEQGTLEEATAEAMSRVEAMRTRTHPGEMLAKEFLEPLEMSAGDLAAALCVPESLIADIVAERVAVTPDIAARIAMHFGMTTEFWTNLQAAHDASSNAKPMPKLHRRPLSWRIRRKLGLTVEEFGELYCIPLDAIVDWERPGTDLSSVELALLKAIAANPDVVAEAQRTEGA